jgi:XTP/dITP diphosphohydrolase
VTRAVTARLSQVVLATRNRGKRHELAAILEPLGVAVLTLDDLGIVAMPDEDELEHFDTFEDNALAKARYFFSRSGLPTLADDSGLVVDALGGRPGVHSKRWSGRTDLAGRALDAANNEKLLAALSSAASRVARFVCVAAYVDGVRELARRGEVEGRILDAARGTGGFGYDPLFYSPELGRTLAEASTAEKERVSHRGRAMRALCDALVDEAEDAAGH